MRLKQSVNPATECIVIKSHCAHIPKVLKLNDEKDDLAKILAPQDLLQVSNFALRFVVRILASVRPNRWPPGRIAIRFHQRMVAQLHDFDYTSNGIQLSKQIVFCRKND